MAEDSTTLAMVAAFLPSITATPTALSVPDTMSYSEWERLGAELRTLGTWTPWATGDWYLAGERLYGEEAPQAVADLGLDFHTVQNAVWVCSRFSPERRRAKLSFSHHAEVAAFPEKIADDWLAFAEENELSRADLRREIRAARREQAAVENGDVVQLPPPVKGRGLVEVNGGLAYVGMTALGDALASLEGYEVDYTFTPIAPADSEEVEEDQ